MKNNLKILASLLIAAAIGGMVGYNLGSVSDSSLGVDLDTILKKVALLEKMGVEIDWSDLSRLREKLSEELRKELDDLYEKLIGKKGADGKPAGGDLPRLIPNPEGWERQLLENGMIQFTRDGEIWWWNPTEGRWQLPPGVTHPDPNPITPTGERLAGRGTF